MASASTYKQRLRQRETQLLPWIADPLTHVLHAEHEIAHANAHANGYEQEKGESRHREEDIIEEIEAEEAASIELFYDLFFVANLTTITSVHYMTDYESIMSYILFFIILWFTWLQTSLYDIRFSVDSFYERIIRSIHFAVMIGFASVSTSWDPMNPSGERSASNLQSMSLTLMASRFALGIQYAVTMIYALKHKKAAAPFAIHSFVMFGAGLIYMGLYITLGLRGDVGKYPNAYLTWYAVIFLEVVGVMSASSKWKVVSFKRTHLVERMSLLTLIIMGEGIIVMLKAVNAVEKSGFFGRGWSRSIFSIVACAILIIYLFYMFYFDYTPKNVHYGSIRQQFWAVLHFPFHLAIVLSVEGLRQVTTWWSFQQAIKMVSRTADKAFVQGGTNKQVAVQGYLGVYTTVIDYLYKDGSSKEILKDYGALKQELLDLSNTLITDWNLTEIKTLHNVTAELVKGCTEFYGIKSPPKAKAVNTTKSIETFLDEGYDPFEDVHGLFDLVFRYFFASLGVVFIMYGVLGLFVRRKKDMWDYISVAIRFVVGILFIGVVFLQKNITLYTRFYTSPWPIPTVCIILLTALFLDKFLGVIAYRSLLSRGGSSDRGLI